MIEVIWSNAEKIGALAQPAIVAVGLSALVAALVQVRSTRRQQREATAYLIYSEQLKLDLQYPQYSHPNLGEIRASNKLGHYDDYVSHMLYSCENILQISDAPGWREAMRYGFRPHAAYFRDHTLKHADTLDDELAALMREVVAEVSATETSPQEQSAGASATPVQPTASDGLDVGQANIDSPHRA